MIKSCPTLVALCVLVKLANFGKISRLQLIFVFDLLSSSPHPPLATTCLYIPKRSNLYPFKVFAGQFSGAVFEKVSLSLSIYRIQNRVATDVSFALGARDRPSSLGVLDRSIESIARSLVFRDKIRSNKNGVRLRRVKIIYTNTHSTAAPVSSSLNRLQICNRRFETEQRRERRRKLTCQ